MVKGEEDRKIFLPNIHKGEKKTVIKVRKTIVEN